MEKVTVKDLKIKGNKFNYMLFVEYIKNINRQRIEIEQKDSENYFKNSCPYINIDKLDFDKHYYK